MQSKYLSEVFAANGNTPVYVRRAMERGETIKRSVAEDMASIWRSPLRRRGYNSFPVSFRSFQYIGSDKQHYREKLQDKPLVFMMEFDRRKEDPFNIVCLQFTPLQLMDLLVCYPHDLRITSQVTAALQPLRIISREVEEFTMETALEYGFDRVSRAMRQQRKGPPSNDGLEPV